MSERRTPTRAERQASNWIVRMKAHDVTDRDRRAFEQWRAAAPEHAEAYAKLERTWAVVASLDHLKGSAGVGAERSARPPRFVKAAIAVTGALMAAGVIMWVALPTPPSGEHYAPRPAEIRTIALTDGSSLVLSAGAEATVLLTGDERRIDLVSGSALFDVTHDAERPFIVHTPKGDISVLGTSFVIRVSADRVTTTVLRGSVRGAAPRIRVLGLVATRETVTAGANEEITFADAHAEVTPISVEAIPRRLAWREGMLAFDGETLSEAIAEVSQQTGWQFELADAELGQMRVGGYVRADAEAFIELLSSSFNLEATRKGERQIVLSRR